MCLETLEWSSITLLMYSRLYIVPSLFNYLPSILFPFLISVLNLFSFNSSSNNAASASSLSFYRALSALSFSSLFNLLRSMKPGWRFKVGCLINPCLLFLFKERARIRLMRYLCSSLLPISHSLIKGSFFDFTDPRLVKLSNIEGSIFF